jgi:Helix-turn-helix domain
VCAKTHEDVASELGWHRSKVGRIEGAQLVRLSLTDLRALLDLYGVTGEEQRQALITLAKDGRERGWWNSYSGVLPNPHSVLIGLEAETVGRPLPRGPQGARSWPTPAPCRRLTPPPKSPGWHGPWIATPLR